MKIFFVKIFIVALVSFVIPSITSAHGTHYNAIADSYNSQIISDSNFRAKDTMSAAQIQSFLESKGSALASYSINFDTGIGWDDLINANGMTAAQVIYNSAQWYDINPQVILATLNKESSLVTSGNLNYLNQAMGYGCPEGSGCNPAYANFAKQIDMATYQFWYNFKYSELADTGRVGAFYAGNTATIDGKATYISNSATAALYRYTMHRPDSGYLTAANGSHYYGNYNFISFYLGWFFPYDYDIISAVNPPPSMTGGDTAFVQVHLRNTGGRVWYNEAEYAADPTNKRPMRLAVLNADGQNFWPNNDTWVDDVRIAMTSASVASGEVGSFNFTIKAPTASGAHIIKFMPVVEGEQALKDIGMQFVINISYDYDIVSATNPPAFMSATDTAFVQVHLRNTGGSTWYNEAEYAADPTNKRPMRLAVLNADGQNFWPNNDTWVDNVRIAMTSSSVASGEVGSFNFTIKAPATLGSHTLQFMPVVEGVQALRDIGMQFKITVVNYDYDIISAVNPPSSMTGGDTAFVQVHLRNTGGSTWYNEAEYAADPTNKRPMRLAVLNADGQNFWPNNDTWVDNVRIAMTSSSVASGEVGSFNFTIKAPATLGSHTLQFMPVVEGVQALRDIGMQFVVVSQ